MSFHELLQNARPRKVTQSQAAELAGVSRGTLSAWERGLLSPTVRQVTALWEVYGTPLDARCEMLSEAVRERGVR